VNTVPAPLAPLLATPAAACSGAPTCAQDVRALVMRRPAEQKLGP
jgi:hypothetical protein